MIFLVFLLTSDQRTSTMPEGEVAMSVTLKRENGVWVVGCLDGTSRTFNTFLDAAMFAAAEYERLAFEVVGWGAEVATC